MVLSSGYVIQRILTALNLQCIGASTYQTAISQNGTVLRVRISNHGVNLSTWYAKNKDEIVPLKDKGNKATHFSDTSNQPPKKIKKHNDLLNK